jgi:hypothetical protein
MSDIISLKLIITSFCMKFTLTSFVLLALVAVSAPAVSADNAPDRSRAVITRTADAVDRPNRERSSSEEVAEDNSNDDDQEGGGVVLDVSYGSDGHLDVNFSNGENSGNVNITVTINGETVSNTGNQTGNQAGGSIDGEDGNDGLDGTVSEEDEEDEPEESESEEEEETDDRYNSRDSRQTFDRNPRR